MVSKRIANPEMLGYDTIIAGRMMHVRIHYDKRAVDILALNQYVHHHTVESYHNRQSWWQHLGDTLSRLPTRNLLACAGDFNCTLPGQAPGTGPNAFRWQQQRVMGRSHDLMWIVRSFFKSFNATAWWP